MIPLAPLLAAALSAAPFVAEQPEVRAGNEQLLSGDAAAALERYDAAERAAGPRPEIDFDRGNALGAQGRHAEAREAYRRALDGDKAGVLSSRALQNMGNALDAAGDRAGAVRAFSEALERDPGNEDARYNLEVLLRRKAAPRPPPDQGGEQKKEPQEKDQKDQKGQQGQQDQKDRTGQQEPRDSKEPGKDEGKQGQAGKPGERPRDERSGGEPRPDGRSRQDAERLLDALRDRERNMPGEPVRRRDARRREAARDW